MEIYYSYEDILNIDKMLYLFTLQLWISIKYQPIVIILDRFTILMASIDLSQQNAFTK